MIASINSCIHQSRRILYRLQTDPRLHTALRILSHLLTGFFLSAASLGNLPQCFTLALVCASSGWPAALIALGWPAETPDPRPRKEADDLLTFEG